MNQFTEFMKDSGDNEEMKQALESVVSEIVKKDTLYEPMKTLKEEYPKWLEANWQKVSDEELERYNKQLDKITEICKLYEDKNASG
jgi:peroxin-19